VLAEGWEKAEPRPMPGLPQLSRALRSSAQ